MCRCGQAHRHTDNVSAENEHGMQWVIRHADKDSKLHTIMLRDDKIDIKKLLAVADITNKREGTIVSTVRKGEHGAHRGGAFLFVILLLHPPWLVDIAGDFLNV